MKSKNRVGSFVVLTRKSRTEVFLVLRSDFPVWECQGGGIENGETPKQCAIREAYEETGFKIKIERKVAEYINPKTKTIDSHIYEGKVVSGTYKREYPECEGRWFNVNNLPTNMIAIRKVMINDCLSNNKNQVIKNSINLMSFNNLRLFVTMPTRSVRYLIKKFF
jgi:ADP-ribose pyrophosphatase YjhB (NUDIX family)